MDGVDGVRRDVVVARGVPRGTKAVVVDHRVRQQRLARRVTRRRRVRRNAVGLGDGDREDTGRVGGLDGVGLTRRTVDRRSVTGPQVVLRRRRESRHTARDCAEGVAHHWIRDGAVGRPVISDGRRRDGRCEGGGTRRSGGASRAGGTGRTGGAGGAGRTGRTGGAGGGDNDGGSLARGRGEEVVVTGVRRGEVVGARIRLGDLALSVPKTIERDLAGVGSVRHRDRAARGARRARLRRDVHVDCDRGADDLRRSDGGRRGSLIDGEGLLDFGRSRVGRIARLVGVHHARTHAGEAHDSVTDGARAGSGGGVDAEHDRVAGRPARRGGRVRVSPVLRTQGRSGREGDHLREKGRRRERDDRAIGRAPSVRRDRLHVVGRRGVEPAHRQRRRHTGIRRLRRTASGSTLCSTDAVLQYAADFGVRWGVTERDGRRGSIRAHGRVQRRP